MFPVRTKSFDHLAIRSTVCLLFVLFALTGLGQSGRRLSKSPAVSVPTPEPGQPEKKPTLTDQPKLNLIVGIHNGDVFSGIPPTYYDSVLESCAGRLDDSRGVHVDVVTREMTRGDAVNRARAEKEGYVIWLQLRTDSYSGSTGNSLNDIYVEYTVLEPGSAKVKTQGNCYPNSSRKGGVVVPRTSGRTNTMIAESRLREAAQEAAERILKALHIVPPSDIPPH
jgi:hypothetical protein